MTVKRSRICRSSSSGETTALLPSSPASDFSSRKDLRIRKATAMAENRRQKPGIFTISSSVPELVDRRSEVFSWKMCGFLEKCSYCSKKFPKDTDIFMYSYLQAFCSKECRQKQIENDKDLEILSVVARTECVNTDTNQGKHGGF